MRIGFYLFAGVLFGAATLLASTVADARSHRHYRLRATPFARQGVSATAASHVAPGGTLKSEDHGASNTDGAFTKGGQNAGRPGQPGPTKAGTESAPGGIENAGAPAKEATPPDGHMKDLGPVDTRISVAPRLHSVKSDGIRSAKTKFRVVPGHSLRAHPKLASPAIVRNAIGMPIDPQSVENQGGRWKALDPDGTGGTLKPRARNGTGSAGLGLRPQASNPVFSPAITTMNHSNISGNIMLRPSTTPVAIGGPAKNSVGALNGTTFRQRHPQ